VLAVAILAGGQASRLPGKLELDAGGVPLLVRVYRRLREAGPVYIAAAGSFPPAIDEALDCPIVVDRFPGRGPLGGLASVFEAIREPQVFAAAGDMPFVSAQTVRELARAWEPGVEAVVPVNAEGYLEPLCALYDRLAFLSAASGAFSGRSSGSVRRFVESLKAKRVRLSDERAFANVNTPEDRRSMLTS
jgi:molybdopterin-guanine dinucleotide biosynthesis protein A